MRKLLLLTVVVAACATERPADDTAATSPATAAPAGTTLTAADVAGNWQGMTYAEGTDSIVSRWQVARLDDTRGEITIEGAPQAIPYTTTFAGDSMIAESAPYEDPDHPGIMVRFRSVGRLQGDRLVGTSELRPADGDSVLSRSRWEATRVQP